MLSFNIVTITNGTGKQLEGGQTITVPVSIEKIPIYVKAGTILPMDPVRQYATQATGAPTELRVYPGKDASFMLYEDENDIYNYEKGKYTLVEFNYSESGRKVHIGERKGSFEGMDAEKDSRWLLHQKNRDMAWTCREKKYRLLNMMDANFRHFD